MNNQDKIEKFVEAIKSNSRLSSLRVSDQVLKKDDNIKLPPQFKN